MRVEDQTLSRSSAGNRRNRVDALVSYKLQLAVNPVLLEACEHGFTQDALLRVRARRVTKLEAEIHKITFARIDDVDQVS